MTAAGLRAAASSILNECGLWNPDAIQAQLVHLEGKRTPRARTPARSAGKGERGPSGRT
jgi:hypothetical protein